MTSPKFKRSDDAIFAAVGDDIVALNVQAGHCYGMENVTVAVWSLLSQPTGLDEICEQLIEEYEVEPAQCRADVEALIEKFQQAGLLEQVGAQSGN